MMYSSVSIAYSLLSAAYYSRPSTADVAEAVGANGWRHATWFSHQVNLQVGLANPT